MLSVARALLVDVLSPEEAVAFLLRRSGDAAAAAADELACELGRLPLSLQRMRSMTAGGRARAKAPTTCFRRRALTHPPGDLC